MIILLCLIKLDSEISIIFYLKITPFIGYKYRLLYLKLANIIDERA